MGRYSITSAAAAGQNPGSALKGYIKEEEQIQENEIYPQQTPTNTAPQRGIPIERFGIDENAKTSEEHGVDYDEDTFNLVTRLADDLNRADNPETKVQERYSKPSDVQAVEFLNPSANYDTQSNVGIDPLTLAERTIISDTSIEQEASVKLAELNEKLKEERVEVGAPSFKNFTDKVGNTLYSVNRRSPQENSRYKYGTDPQIVSAINKLGVYNADPNVKDVDPAFTSALSFAIIDQVVSKRVEAEERLQKARDEIQENPKGLTEEELLNAQIALDEKTREANEQALNSQNDANSILKTAEKVLRGPKVPVNAGESVVDTLTPQEQSALMDSVYRDLEEKEYLSQGLTNSDGQTITWTIGPNLGKVMKSIPDVIDTLQGANVKEPSNSPNPGGRTATHAGSKYKPTGKTATKVGLRWLSKVEKALDYYGTTPMWISTPTLNAEFNLLQDILSFKQDLKLATVGQDGQSLNTSLFFNNDPNKRLSLAISDHPAASYFKMDINSLRSAFNSSRPIPPKDENERYVYPRVPFLKKKEDLLNTIANYNAGLETNPDAVEWITSAVEKFNQGVSDYTNPLFEANGRKGNAFFFHQELIGVNGRMRIADNTINPQTSPAFRGLITPNKVIIVDPDSKSERTQNFKAMVARNLNLTMKLVGKDGKYVTRIKGGIESVAEVKAEHLPRLKQRVELFDLYFGTDPISSSDVDYDYKKAKRDEGSLLVSAARSMSAIGTDNSINSSMNDAISTDLNKDYSATKSVDKSRGSKFSERWANALGYKASRFNRSENLPQTKYNVIQGPKINDPAVRDNIAFAIGAKERGPNGKIHNEHKEGSIRMNTLMNLARFQKGDKFRSDIVAELDGINNNFAILSLLLGDYDLALNSGLINPNLEDTGQIVTDGDMRDFIQGKAQELFDGITEEYFNTVADAPKDSEQFKRTAKVVLDAIDLIGSGTTKLAWKDIIMQAGYGKDFSAFPDMFYNKLSSDTDFINGLEERLGNQIDDVNKDPLQALYATSKLVPIILGKALGTLKNYTDLTKRTGTLASILKQEYVTVASSGFPSSMLKSSTAPIIKGHVDDNVVRANLSHDYQGTGKRGLALEKQFELDPLQIKGGANDGAGRTTLKNIIKDEYDVAREFAKKAELREDTPKNFWNFLKDVAFAQRNRAPVLPIHAEDASVMVTVANYASNKNASRSPKDKIWFYQIFDALMVDVDSYTDIPKEYNRALVEQVATLDRYGQDLLELAKFKRNAIKTGDIEVAMILEKLTSASLDKDLKGHLEILQRRTEKTRQKILDELREVNEISGTQSRYTDYDAFVKKRDSLVKRLDTLHLEPRYKVSESVMETLFKNFTPFNDQVRDLKVARKGVKHKSEILYQKLIAQAKQMNSDVDYDITNVGLGTHNAS